MQSLVGNPCQLITWVILTVAHGGFSGLGLRVEGLTGKSLIGFKILSCMGGLRSNQVK